MLYDEFAPALYGMVLRIVGSEPVAEDVLQDAFIKIWRNAHTYCPAKGSVFAWALQIARRTALDKRRSSAFRSQANTAPLPEPYLSRGASACWNEELLDVAGMVNALDVSQREVIELIYFQGFTHKEVQQYLGIPLGTVKSRLRLGLQKMKRWFEEHPLLIGLLALMQMWTS